MFMRSHMHAARESRTDAMHIVCAARQQICDLVHIETHMTALPGGGVVVVGSGARLCCVCWRWARSIPSYAHGHPWIVWIP